MKMNSLVDGRCIRALYAASQAGVRVDLNVRGICCLRPGVPGISENIRVVSIVGRLLEHSRVYAFERGGEHTIYIASADLMPRNLDHRVELAVPIETDELRAELLDVLERCFADNQSSWELDADGRAGTAARPDPEKSRATCSWSSPSSTPRAPAPSRGGRAGDRHRGRRRSVSGAGEGLHPLVGGFSDAAAYDAGRPRYDARVVALLVEALELGRGAPVLELGAGTGQLSGALLAAGLDLTAVEPLGPTRELLRAAIGEERVREGRAEDIPLADSSVRAVFAADAFHWFDETRAMPEIKRVLAPGGGVAILRMVPRVERPWSREFGEIVMESRPEHPAFGERGARGAAALEEDPAFGAVTATTVTTPGVLDREQLLAWVASFSWVAALAPEQRASVIERVGELLRRNEVQRVEYDVLAQIWLARLL